METNYMESNYIFVPIGIDCCIAYQLQKLNLRHFSLPLDWIYIKNISSVIELFNDNFLYFLDITMYEIIKIKSNNFSYNKTNEISQYKLKHKKYNIILPHELQSLEPDKIQLFINRYNRRIKRLFELNNQSKKIIFIRLGFTKELKLIDKLNNSLSKYFTNYELKFIDLSTLEKTIDWKRNEINWLKYFTIYKDK
jgi:hypothetical protein